jgi:hypothetical protein
MHFIKRGKIMQHKLFTLFGAFLICAALSMSAQADLVVQYDGSTLPQDQLALVGGTQGPDNWVGDYGGQSSLANGVLTVTGGGEQRAWYDYVGAGTDSGLEAEINNGWQIRARMSVPDAPLQNFISGGGAPNPINQPTGEGGVDGLPSGGELWSFEVTLFQHDGGRIYRLGMHTDGQGNNDPIVTFSDLNGPSPGSVTPGSAIHGREVAGKAGQFVVVDMINETGGGAVDVYADGVLFADDVTPSSGWTGAPNQFYIGDCCGGNGTSNFSIDYVNAYVDRSGSGGTGLPGPVPEPSTCVMIVFGFLGLAGYLRRR